MHVLRMRMGTHSLPIVLGRRTGALRAQRQCQRWDQHAAMTTPHDLHVQLCGVCEAGMLHC